MSSTDGREERALRFFRERLVPAAERLRERRAALIAGGPDADAPTYYAVRARGESYVVDLNAPLAEVLRAQWKEHPELAALVDELVELGQSLRQPEEESAEVSPFIYAMF